MGAAAAPRAEFDLPRSSPSPCRRSLAMSVPITKRLKRTIQQRAIQGMIRTIIPLHPEYDRPGIVGVTIQVHPNNSTDHSKFLLINESYKLP